MMNGQGRGGVWRAALVALMLCVAASTRAQDGSATSDPYIIADQLFEDFRLDTHVPGLVFGVVADGKLVHVASFGVQDLDKNRPVTADSLFRIASMTKAFTALTILKLRDDGRLRLDNLAEDYVPEMRGWSYPTDDSPRIGVRDLLSHAAGFVTDDPWGDRQTPLPEPEFTRLLQKGVPFTRAPGTGYEYSNLGYALLGRIITNVSKAPFEQTITRTLLAPLGMTSSGFDAAAAAPERRALGYRWEDGAWRLEPLLGPGAFGAMGGLQTSAHDYAKWVAFLLSAWPPRDGAEEGPVKRATVRELAQGLNFASVRQRPGHSSAESCRQAVTYGKGMRIAIDCELGLTLGHGGGYPGYGSYMLLLPERGVGLFVFTNRTYAGPAGPLFDAALLLDKKGVLPPARLQPIGADLAASYRAAAAIYAAGSVSLAKEALAMNFLLDRDSDGWSRDLAKLKVEVGDCPDPSPIKAIGALSGEFVWRCARGRVKGSLELAPTRPPRIQQLQLERVSP